MFGSSAATGGSDAIEFSRRRVATYVATLAGLFGTFYLIDLVSLAVEGNVAHLAEVPELAHVGVVASLVALGIHARKREHSAAALAALDVCATLLVAGLAGLIIPYGPADDIYAGPAFGIALVLVVRAALVPCSALRTLSVGAVVAAVVVTAYALRDAPNDLDTGFVSIWMLLFVGASALVSRVIYGLQASLLEARRLGQYELEDQLGAGGMGVVYRANHSLLRRPTAVKLLLPHRADERYLERFEQEVRMTSRLSHPNTVTIYDYGRTPDGRFYYAMELLDGADLNELVDLSGPQCAARTLHVLTRIARALREAHEIGLIHRDIKPSNIMLCKQGGLLDTPKLLDFGLVRDVEANSSAIASDEVVGTPLYLSPEAISEPASVDARSDLYALGAVGYYMLAGTHVFEGGSPAEVCHKHLYATPVPPSERLGAPVGAGLEAVVMACLAKAPSERPADSAELLARLGACTDVPAWLPADANAWWEQHAAALRDRRAARTPAVEGLTLDISRKRRSRPRPN